MRNYLLIAISVLLLAPLSSTAQIVQPQFYDTNTPFSIPESLNERIEVFTDRHIYGIGEKILFTGTAISAPELKGSGESRVLYLELLTPGGTSVAQGKFHMAYARSSGYITIPEHLLTGNYYLVAYTKWMRNFTPLSFHYKLIKIINPYSQQLEIANFSNGISQTHEWEPKPVKKILTCSTDKSIYHQREKVKLMINIPGTSQSLTNTYSVSVVNTGSADSLETLKILPEKVQYHSTPGTIYLPESRGLSLSGRIVSTDSTLSVPGEIVNLAVLGQEPGFRAIQASSSGNFCFALDSLVGRNDMYIATNHDDENMEILIDNDFANPVVKFPDLPFLLSESEKELAAQLIFNIQINSHFPSTSSIISETDDKQKNPKVIAFYGLPSASVQIDDFIDLPTLKEVLIELAPGVFPRERNQEPYLSFNGNKLTFNLISQYPPLLLVDHLPVLDLKKLLLMSPKKIYRVEVLNEIYILGNITYGGILNIITRKGDLAGIDLPENSFFFDFPSFLPQEKLIFPRYEVQEFDSENPDYRNCLYWSPDIKATPGQDLELDFFTSDNNGEYQVLIRGVGEDGSILEGKCYFHVD